MKVLVLVVIYFLMEAYEARKYAKCELYEELKKHGLDGYKGIGVGHLRNCEYWHHGFPQWKEFVSKICKHSDLDLDRYPANIKRICLSMYASGFDTEYYENTGGHPHYGLFHFHGLTWCSNGRHISKNLCKIDCDKFLDDDIRDDIECAKKVAASKRGMLSWRIFQEYCRHPMPQLVSWECIDE